MKSPSKRSPGRRSPSPPVLPPRHGPATGTEASPAGPERAALAWVHGARFFTTASQLDQLPPGELPEIAFVGRSNAGKSTAINVLAQHRRLAFASRTPGRTQHINLFALGARGSTEAFLADLPGYGYAAVDRQAKRRWQQVMADYLVARRNLLGLVLLVDSRLGLTELDRALLDLVWPRVASGEVRLLVLLTKSDKLGRGEAQSALQAVARELADRATEACDIGVALFSALSRQGLADVALTLHGWVLALAASGANAPPAPAAAQPPEPALPAVEEPRS